MTADAKMEPGDVLIDPITGEDLEIVRVTSGRMPTPIDPSEYNRRGGFSSSERCALYGQSRAKIPAKRGAA